MEVLHTLLIENAWVPVGAIPCGCLLKVERVFLLLSPPLSPGQNGEKAALGKSAVIKGQDAAKTPLYLT